MGSVVTVKGKATPEHKVHQTPYNVFAMVDTSDKVIMDAACLGCKAQKGGCKHAIAFVFWLLRRSEEGSVTDVKCYWKKAKLSNIKNLSPFKVSSEEKKGVLEPDVNKVAFRKEALSMLKAQGFSAKTQAAKLMGFEDRCIQNLYMDMLVRKYVDKVGVENLALEGFLHFCKTAVHLDICTDVEQCTRAQKDSPMWHHVRFGRVTASRLYEVAHCRTVQGSLVESMLGASKFAGTTATRRGVVLEGKVLSQVSTLLGVKCSPSGVCVSMKWPMFGASPDAVVLLPSGQVCAVVEVKCPVSDQAVGRYYDMVKGSIMPRYRAQLQLQMLLAGCEEGYFCVASPDFETSGDVKVITDKLCRKFLEPLMERAQNFWYSAIFPMLAKGRDPVPQ